MRELEQVGDDEVLHARAALDGLEGLRLARCDHLASQMRRPGGHRLRVRLQFVKHRGEEAVLGAARLLDRGAQPPLALERAGEIALAAPAPVDVQASAAIAEK